MRKIYDYLNFVAARSRSLVLKKIQLDQHFPDGSVVLELGCGDGEFARSLRAKSPKIGTYIGCDVNNLLLENNVLDNYYIIDTDSFREVIEKENPDRVVIAYTLHHIMDEEIIKQYLDICKNRGIKILVIEEIAINRLYKQLLCLNDLGNVFEYSKGISNWREYFAFNFKSRLEWSNLFMQSGYSTKTIATGIRKFFVYIEMYELS